MILEQKLGGGNKLKKWENIDQELHKSVDNETGSRKSSHNSQSGHIPIPPPPPIAPSFTKPLYVNTDNNESGSLVSSYYSPGGSTPTPDQPPAPVAPVLNGDHGEARYRRKGDRGRRDDSVSSHQTEKTE